MRSFLGSFSSLHPGIVLAAAVALLFALAAPSAAGPDKLEHSKGRVHAVNADASLLTIMEGDATRTYRIQSGDRATRITRDGHMIKASDLAPGAPVFVYWRPAAEKSEQRVAVKVDALLIPEGATRDLVDAWLEMPVLPEKQ